jgi:hypothetical protein
MEPNMYLNEDLLITKTCELDEGEVYYIKQYNYNYYDGLYKLENITMFKDYKILRFININDESIDFKLTYIKNIIKNSTQDRDNQFIRIEISGNFIGTTLSSTSYFYIYKLTTTEYVLK